MNKKLIAVAVAGVVAAPAAYADISAYGRINNGIAFTESDDGENTQDMGTYGSRFGFKGSGDIGNGMNAFARYEFSTHTDTAGSGSGIGRRLAFVGLSGSFGTISLGQQWSGYFKTIGSYASLNYWNGPGSVGTKREGNTIQYSNGFGPVSLILDARVDDAMDGSDEGNGFAGGVALNPMDNVRIGAAYDSDEATDTDVAGVVGGISLGGFDITLAHEQKDVNKGAETNNTLFWLGTNVSGVSLSLGYGKKETKTPGMPDSESSNLMVGGHYVLGGGLRVWGEFVKTETDSVDDPEIFVLGVRMDF